MLTQPNQTVTTSSRQDGPGRSRSIGQHDDVIGSRLGERPSTLVRAADIVVVIVGERCVDSVLDSIPAEPRDVGHGVPLIGGIEIEPVHPEGVDVVPDGRATHVEFGWESRTANRTVPEAFEKRPTDIPNWYNR